MARQMRSFETHRGNGPVNGFLGPQRLSALSAGMVHKNQELYYYPPVVEVAVDRSVLPIW